MPTICASLVRSQWALRALDMPGAHLLLRSAISACHRVASAALRSAISACHRVASAAPRLAISACLRADALGNEPHALPRCSHWLMRSTMCCRDTHVDLLKADLTDGRLRALPTADGGHLLTGWQGRPQHCEWKSRRLIAESRHCGMKERQLADNVAGVVDCATLAQSAAVMAFSLAPTLPAGGATLRRPLSGQPHSAAALSPRP